MPRTVRTAEGPSTFDFRLRKRVGGALGRRTFKFPDAAPRSLPLSASDHEDSRIPAGLTGGTYDRRSRIDRSRAVSRFEPLKMVTTFLPAISARILYAPAVAAAPAPSAML